MSSTQTAERSFFDHCLKRSFGSSSVCFTPLDQWIFFKNCSTIEFSLKMNLAVTFPFVTAPFFMVYCSDLLNSLFRWYGLMK